MASAPDKNLVNLFLELTVLFGNWFHILIGVEYYEYTEEEMNDIFALLGPLTGCVTGNGKKLSWGQAEPSHTVKSAVA